MLSVASAAEAGNEAAVKELLRGGSSSTGSLHAAAAFDRHTILRHLLEVVVDVHEIDSSGCTALHRAADIGAEASLLLLLAKDGALVRKRDLLGRTPLHSAILSCSSVACILALLKAGADPDALDDMGKSPLQLALQAAQLEAGESKTGGGKNSPLFSTFFALLKEGKTLLEAAAAATARLAPTSTVSTSDLLENNSAVAVRSLWRPLQPPSSTSAATPKSAPREQTSRSTERQEVASSSASKGRNDDESRAASSSSERESDEDKELELEADRVAKLLQAKVQLSIQQGVVKDATEMFNVLDSAGEGSCSSGDLASGALDIGITLKPKLLPRLIQNIVGRSNAKSIRASEFVDFIKRNK